jgi:hypothetical protein
MGQRSATETLFGIVHLFIENRTWSQAELARRLELGVPALRKRLVELQAAGWPLERSDEDATQVYWSVPREWLPGALHFKETEAVELLRQIGRLPQCAARTELLRAVVARLPPGVRDAASSAASRADPGPYERRRSWISRGYGGFSRPSYRRLDNFIEMSII